MSNLKAVPRDVEARVLADFFREAHVANRPAVDAETLRQAVAPVTFHRRPELNGQGQ